MKRQPQSRQAKKDNNLLLRLLLVPLPKKSRQNAVVNFFSHPVWQGIGGLLGLLSLLVTIALTFYIFERGREQEIAHIYYVYARGNLEAYPKSVQLEKVMSEEYMLFIHNRGPAVGEAVVISVFVSGRVECYYEPLAGASSNQITRPSRVEKTGNRCTFYYDYFYPNTGYSILVVVPPLVLTNGTVMKGPWSAQVIITGANVVHEKE